MADVFSDILNMSLTGTVVILFVLAARLVLKKVPKIFSYALWSVVLFRLLCPVSIPAPVSVLEVAGPEVTQSQGITSSVSYIPADYVRVEPAVAAAVTEAQSRQAEPQKSLSMMEVFSYVWLAGIAVMAAYSILTYVRLRRNLIGAVRCRGNVYLADRIASPFVLGVLRPKIYLPSDTPAGERRFIVAHERHHIRRCDHIIKLLAYAALCLHWFNPLVWVSFILAGKDMEMSCDEAVIKQLGPQIRADYSASLLRLATHRKIIAGTPLAFGEGDTKGRVMNMANWKKPKLWVSMLAVVLCIGIVIACGMNPEGNTGTEVAMNGFHVIIPEEYIVENADHGVIIRDGETQIGGLAKRTSLFQLKFGGNYALEEHNSYEWLEALGIPDVRSDWTVGMSDDGHGVDLPDGFLRVNCHPAGEEEQGTLHFLCFGKGNDVYDLWFNRSMIEDKTIEDILNTAYLKESSEFGVEVGEIPYGYYLETAEHKDTTELIFVIGSNTVGGVTSYPIPGGVYDPEDTVFEWLEDVGIPDFEDESLAYMGGITAPGGGWLAEFVSDVPEGVAPTVDRRHHFYPIGYTVYDIWFDMMLVDFATSEEIRQAVKLPNTEVPKVAETAANTVGETDVKKEASISADKIIAGPETILYGNLTMTLPDDYTCREENGSIILTKDGTDVGGITCWATPNFELVFPSQSVQGSNMPEWIQALGLPEAQESDEPIAYMIGNGAYGDLDAEYFHELEPEKLNVRHEFFVDGTLVYDVYFDQNDITYGQAEKLLKTIAISGEPVVTPEPSEEEGLTKCRNILSQIQSGSYSIASDRKNTGTIALNDYSYSKYWQHNGNWLSITEIPESGASSFFYYMEVDGVHYNTERTGWDENGPIWAEQTKVEVAKPWLATFQWSEDTVAYLDTIISGGEECVMLRIDEPYPYGEGNSEFYFVNFYFVDGGAFLRADLSVNLFMDNAFDVSESIVTLDAQTVAAEIEKEYNRATKSQ